MSTAQERATEEFVFHMKAMAEHYGSGATHTYALPSALLYGDPDDETGITSFAAANDDDPDGTAAVNADLNDYKTSMTETVNSSGDAAKKSVDTLKSSSGDQSDTDAFVAAMKKQEAEQQAAAKKQIHKNFQKLIDTGVKHPKQQKRILTATQLIGAYFTQLLGSVGKFFSKLADSVVSFFKDVGKWFEGAYNSVKNWVSGAAHSVGHFFSSLF